MKLTIDYKAGGGFSVEAQDTDELELLTNLALKILWGNGTSAVTLDEMEKWLGWDKR